jgi:hypothetical protein
MHVIEIDASSKMQCQCVTLKCNAKIQMLKLNAKIHCASSALELDLEGEKQAAAFLWTGLQMGGSVSSPKPSVSVPAQSF